MGSFFESFLTEYSAQDAAHILEWLFNEDRFDSNLWFSEAKEKLTQRIRELGCFEK